MNARAAEGEAFEFDAILPIADAVLYEGYVLYPYRASSQKNRVRWTFGGVYPRTYSHAQTGNDQCEVGTECLVRGADARLVITARFLELGNGAAELGADAATPRSFRVDFGPLAALSNTAVQREYSAGRLHAELAVRVTRLSTELFRVRVTLSNESNCPALERAHALPETLVAAHLLLAVNAGEFISQLDPPAALAEHARACEQRGLWPVLAGPEGSTDRVLASPIILYDYPRIAPESSADCCDGTEIDEILLLRVLTLSDTEKQELRTGEPRARAILARAEALSAEELLRLHGRLEKPERAIRVGERVVLRPKARADIFDIALVGRTATVRSVERDFEDRVHLSVTVDDDPGADLGELGLPGHRFYFFLDEIERTNEGAQP